MLAKKSYKKLFVLLGVIAMLEIYIGAAFDDPSHLFNPDPACPICNVVATSVVVQAICVLVALFDSLFFILSAVHSKISPPALDIVSIRGPPFRLDSSLVSI